MTQAIQMGRGKGVTKLEDGMICRAVRDKGMSKAGVARLLGRSRKTIFERIRIMKETGEWDQKSLDLPRPDLSFSGDENDKN